MSDPDRQPEDLATDTADVRPIAFILFLGFLGIIGAGVALAFFIGLCLRVAGAKPAPLPGQPRLHRPATAAEIANTPTP